MFSGCYNPKGIKLKTRLHISLSHLKKHKFKDSFQDFEILFPIANMKMKQLLTTYFTPINKIKNINSSILEQSDIIITKYLPF